MLVRLAFWRTLAPAGVALTRLLFAPVCSVCNHQPTVGAERICAGCRAELMNDPGRSCARCAAGVGPYTDTTGGCAECRRFPIRFDAAVRLGPYRDTLRACCLACKRARGLVLVPDLGRLLIARRGAVMRTWDCTLVVSVPLHWRRRAVRGFNQADALARSLGRHLRIPVASHILKRVRSTTPQAGLSSDRRWVNVRGAFRARPVQRLRGATVLLVDDILTTGATCSEAARALKQAGAARVMVAVIARTDDGS